MDCCYRHKPHNLLSWLRYVGILLSLRSTNGHNKGFTSGSRKTSARSFSQSFALLLTACVLVVTAALPGLAANQGLPPLLASEALRALLEAVKHGRMGSECVAHSISSEQETRVCNSQRRYQSCTCEVSHATALMVRRIRTRDGNVVDVVLTVEADVCDQVGVGGAVGGVPDFFFEHCLLGRAITLQKLRAHRRALRAQADEFYVVPSANITSASSGIELPTRVTCRCPAGVIPKQMLSWIGDEDSLDATNDVRHIMMLLDVTNVS